MVHRKCLTVPDPIRQYNFISFLNPSGRNSPGDYLDFNSDECQRQRNILESIARPVREADNCTAIMIADCLQNVRSSTSHNCIGIHGLLRHSSSIQLINQSSAGLLFQVQGAVYFFVM
jgi:hypothetical protein